MAKRPAASVYVFKVALEGNKDIWRRIAIRSDQTLDDLHGAIFKAFGRDEEHLYSFYFPPPGSRSRRSLRQAIEFTHPEAADEGGFGDRPTHDAARTRLRTLGLKPRQRFFYLFDFGDEWWHELTVENIDAAPEKRKYPYIVEQEGTSPPQYSFDEEE